MSRETPHDALFKRVFSSPENAAGELRAMVPEALSQQVDWSSLRLEPGSFVDPELTDSHTDLLFSARCGESKTLLYVLFEHQSSGDELMAFRVLRYVVRVWDAFLRDNTGARRLPAVVPVVLQHEPGGWKHATELSALIDMPPDLVAALGDHLPRLRFILDDLAVTDEGQLRGRSLSAVAALGLLLLSRARTSPDLLADLARWKDLLVRVVTAPTGLEALKAFLVYIYAVADVRPAGLRKLVSELGPAAEEAFMTTAQQLRTEGRLEGKLEGKLEGRVETLVDLLEARFGPVSAEVMARLRTASLDDLRVWTRRVVSASTLEEVFA